MLNNPWTPNYKLSYNPEKMSCLAAGDSPYFDEWIKTQSYQSYQTETLQVEVLCRNDNNVDIDETVSDIVELSAPCILCRSVEKTENIRCVHCHDFVEVYLCSSCRDKEAYEVSAEEEDYECGFYENHFVFCSYDCTQGYLEYIDETFIDDEDGSYNVGPYEIAVCNLFRNNCTCYCRLLSYKPNPYSIAYTYPLVGYPLSEKDIRPCDHCVEEVQREIWRDHERDIMNSFD